VWLSRRARSQDPGSEPLVRTRAAPAAAAPTAAAPTAAAPAATAPAAALPAPGDDRATAPFRLYRWTDPALVAVAVLSLAAGFGQFGAVASLGNVAKTYGHLTHGATSPTKPGCRARSSVSALL
jgi:hypothetical protein